MRLFAHPGNPDALAVGRQAPARRARPPASCCRCARARSSPRGRCSGACARPPNAQRRAPALRDPPGRRSEHDRPAADPGELVAARRRAAPAGRQRRERPARRDGQRRVPACPRTNSSARCSSDPGIEIYAMRPPATSPPARSTSACSRCSRSSRAAACSRPSARCECGHSEMTVSGYVSEHYTGDAVDISAINGIADRRPPGRGHDHRPDDPHAADAAGRIRAAPDHQPDAVPGRAEHARDARTLEPHPRRLPPDRGSAAAGRPGGCERGQRRQRRARRP